MAGWGNKTKVMHDAAIVMFSLAESISRARRPGFDARCASSIERLSKTLIGCARKSPRVMRPQAFKNTCARWRKHAQLLDATQSGRSHAN